MESKGDIDESRLSGGSDSDLEDAALLGQAGAYPGPSEMSRWWCGFIMNVVIAFQFVVIVILGDVNKPARSISGTLVYALHSSDSRTIMSPATDFSMTAPANDVVAYKTITSVPYFFERSPYLGTDRAMIDPMWEDLYDCNFPGTDASNTLEKH